MLLVCFSATIGTFIGTFLGLLLGFIWDQAADGAVILMFKTGADGRVQMCISDCR